MNSEEDKQTKISTVDMSNDDLLNRLKEQQVRYPAWAPNKVGAILAGKIEDVQDFPYMHQGKGAIMATINTGLSGDDEHCAFWLNTVAQSQLLKLRNAKLEKGEEPVEMEADFETRAEALKELVGTSIIIQYQGEEKSKDKAKKGFNPYQKFFIVER